MPQMTSEHSRLSTIYDVCDAFFELGLKVACFMGKCMLSLEVEALDVLKLDFCLIYAESNVLKFIRLKTCLMETFDYAPQLESITCSLLSCCLGAI